MLASIILICFFFIYPLFQIGLRELRWDEGYYAAMAVEMDLLRPETVAQGELIASFPLFPWITALTYKLAPVGIEFGLRLVSVLSIAAISIVVWQTARKALSEDAGLLAAAATFSSAIVIEKGLDGYPDMLGNVFLFAAWTTWFNMGAVKNRWNAAWILSFLFCGLAFYSIGWKALFFFALPLFFMRRPLTVWSRLMRPGFFAGLGILLCFILIWLVPMLARRAEMPFRSLSLGISDKNDFIFQVLYFPLELPTRLLPWSLLAWPAFCVAYQPLEKNQVFSRFMRTIFVSISFALCFMPDLDWRNATVLAAPSAVLAAINYPLLVRRHGNLIVTLLKFIFLLLIPLSALIFALHLICMLDSFFPGSAMKYIFIEKAGDFNLKEVLGGELFKRVNLFAMIESVIVMAVAIFMHKGKLYKLPVWTSILILVSSLIACYWMLIAPFQAHDQDSRKLAKTIEAMIGTSLQSGSAVIYKSPEIKGLNAPFLYLNCRVKKLSKSFDEIPIQENKVYAVSPEVPVSKDRTWKSLNSAPLMYKKHELNLWEGTPAKKNGDEHESGQ